MSHRIHAGDVTVEHVDGLETLASALCVEVEAARREPPHLQHASHDLGAEDRVGREVVGVPAVGPDPHVGVDRTERSGVHRRLELVLHGVTGEPGVIRLDVQLEVFEQIELAEEVEAGRGIRIVLMRGRFLGLGLDVELALETDSMLVIDGEMKEPGEVASFPLHVGVDDRPVAFASSPEDVTLAAEPMGRFQRGLDLRRRMTEDVDQRAGPGAGGVPLMGEETRGSPEELATTRLHLGFDGLDHRFEVAFALGDIVAPSGAMSRS